MNIHFYSYAIWKGCGWDIGIEVVFTEPVVAFEQEIPL